MDKQKKGEIPLIFPVALTHDKNFKNYSEQRRCEKYLKKLLDLKTYIEKDDYNDKNYIKEVS